MCSHVSCLSSAKFSEPQSDFADQQFVVITFLRAYGESRYSAADESELIYKVNGQWPPIIISSRI